MSWIFGTTPSREEVIREMDEGSVSSPATPHAPARPARRSSDGGNDGGNDGGDGGGWWSSLKNTATSVTAVLGEDLGEFVSTIKTDTKVAVSGDGGPRKGGGSGTPGGGGDGVADLVSSVLGLGDDGGDETGDLHSPAKPKQRKSGSEPRRAVNTYNRHELRLHELRTDPATFLNEVEEQSAYASWRAGFDLEAATDQISALLAATPEVQSLHTKFVPRVVSYADFWQRYFYRVHKVEAERKRREDLARLAQQSSEGEDDFGWDDLDDDDDDVDVNLGDNGGVPNAETAPSTAEAAAATAVVAESPREEAVDGIVTGGAGNDAPAVTDDIVDDVVDDGVDDGDDDDDDDDDFDFPMLDDEEPELGSQADTPVKVAAAGTDGEADAAVDAPAEDGNDVDGNDGNDGNDGGDGGDGGDEDGDDWANWE